MELYAILQLPKKAPIEDVKKAYKKLVLQYHPDKPTGDRVQFDNLQKAYQILSDPEQKRLYDLTIDDGILSNLFDFLYAHIKKTPKSVPPIKATLKVTLQELFDGEIKKLVLRVRNDDVYRKTPFYVNLMEHKQEYVFPNQGDAIYGHKGDVIIRVQVQEHPTYKIDTIFSNYDLYTEHSITLHEYYTGIHTTLDVLGTPLDVHLDRYERTHVYPDHGLPYLKDGELHYGNLYVHFRLELPDSIPSDAFPMLKQYFGK